MDKPNLQMNIRYQHEDGRGVESCHCMEDFDREYAHALLDEFLDAYEDGRAYETYSEHDYPHELAFTPCAVH